MIRNRPRTLFALLALCMIAPVALGQTQDPGRLLASCIRDNTLAVVQIDVTRIDTDALYTMLTETASGTITGQEIVRFREIAQRWHAEWPKRVAQFKEAGGRELVIVWTLQGPVLAVPVTGNLNEQAMKDWLGRMWADFYSGAITYLGRDGLLVSGPKPMLDRLGANAPSRRAEFDRAAAKTSDAAVHIFVVPSRDSRRVLEAMLPSLLGAGLSVKTNALVEGLQWATIDIRSAPHHVIQPSHPIRRRLFRTGLAGPSQSDPWTTRRDSVLRRHLAAT